jgi:RNA polymerase sigma-70 factor (ECF subfamily)
MVVAPTPVVALNRAVAVAELAGPETALDLVDELRLDRYHLFHSVRGNLLRRLGRSAEATAAYEQALALAPNEVDRTLLRRLLAG